MDFLNEPYAFQGVLEFEASLEILGKKVVRQVRIVWERTPDWEYFDVKLRRPVQGSGRGTMYVELQAMPEREELDRGDDGQLKVLDRTPYWMTIVPWERGILPDEVVDEIDERIDQACKEKDARRRAEYHSNR